MTYTTLKNTVLTGAVSLLAFNASSANAEGYYDYGSSYDYCDPCPQVACPCPCDSNFYVGAEALIWKVNNKDQNYGATTTVVENDVTVTTIGLQSADHNWNLGFRIFGGYKVDDCCDWELYLAYTNLNSRASGSFEPTIDLFGLEFNPEINFRNRLKYQTFDALVAKEFAVNQCGYIRPFFGFRGLWMDQNPEVSLQLTDEDNDLLVVANSLDSCVNAYGLHGGAEYYWTICDGFGVYGTIGASVLHADIKNTHTLAVLAEGEDEGTLILDTLTINDNQCSPMFGYLLGAGVRYETDYCACGTNMLVRLDLGYEFNHWLCTPQLLDGGSLEEAFEVSVLGVERSNGGSLLLQGVRIGLGLYF